MNDTLEVQDFEINLPESLEEFSARFALDNCSKPFDISLGDTLEVQDFEINLPESLEEFSVRFYN